MVIALILAIALWVGGAMACAAIPAWLVMLVLGAAGFHVGYVPCLLVGTLLFLPFCKAKVTLTY